MRVRNLTLSLALVMSCTAIGCKSAPKLPWFSTADKTAESAAAVAQTTTQAPKLPSEIAKQAEGISTSDPVKIATAPAAASTAPAATTKAPAYTATNISPYPNTGAQGYLPTSPTTSAATTATTAATTAVKSALPYNPAAVPPVANSTVATNAATTSPVQSDRYGTSPSADRYSNAYTPSPVAATTPTSYPATAPTDTTTPTSSSPATSGVPFASNPGSSSLGDRYATQNTPIAQPVDAASPTTNTAPSYSASPVQPASAVASVQPYRPGGTSSYPGTSANYEVATKPGTTTPSGQNAPLYR